MNVKRLDKSALDGWVDTCIAAGDVYGVKAKGDRFAFGPLEKGSDLRIDYDVTLLPPKKYFQPQREVLNTFNKIEGFQSVVEDKPFALFGVHPYDMVAINQMDAIFSQDNADVHYLARRENATVVACDIENASENVFASSMGNATVDEGFDILLTRIGDDEYLVDVRTQKGQNLAESIATAPDASEEDLEKRKAVQEESQQKCNKHQLNPEPKDLPALLSKAYEHPVWEEKAERCYSCGSCNLVCPTCYCFDVKDDVDWDMENVERKRIWDGCLLTDFAVTAGGHNFRRDKAARYRHRYLRKGQYVPEKIGGEIACVGCGRCITACTSFIANPVEVFNAIAEDSQ